MRLSCRLLFSRRPTPRPAPAAAAAPAAAEPVAALVVNAAAYLVVEATSGQVLAGSNKRQRRDPASLTKLMTAYLVFDACTRRSCR